MIKKVLFSLALFSCLALHAKPLSPEQSNYIGAMRMIYKDIPVMSGEYMSPMGYREYNGAILAPSANTIYESKECTKAGSYSSCTSKKDSSCEWIGKISEQCKTL